MMTLDTISNVLKNKSYKARHNTRSLEKPKNMNLKSLKPLPPFRLAGHLIGIILMVCAVVADAGPGRSQAGALERAAAGIASRPPAKRDFAQLDKNIAYTPGRLLVRFAAGVKGAQQTAILSALGGASIEREFKIVPGLSVVKLAPGQTVKEALVSFNRTAGVLYAEPDYELQAIATFPNDTRFSELWGLHNTGQTGGTPDADIDAPEAWDINTGSSNVVVAVIDTGVDYNHPDLIDNMWHNPGEIPGNGLDDDGNGFVDDVFGYDFVGTNDNDPMDDQYHGTHVAGTIGAEGSNSLGVVGVTWRVQIMALKFLDATGFGSTADAIECIEYATANGAHIMSNSWGGEGYDQSLKDAIDAAGAAGIIFVAAAGNDYGQNNDQIPHYPSSYESANLVAVLSTDHFDALSDFSNYGATSVDIGAPGSDILSCEPGGGYQLLSGTSMATPHIAGACALLLSANPSLSVQQMKQALLSTVDPTLPGLCVSGGRLNLAAALVFEPPPPAPILSVESHTLSGPVVPNDCNELTIVIVNSGDATAMGITGTLSTTTPDVTVSQNTSSYPNLPPGASAANDPPFTISTSPSFVCGTTINLELVLTHATGVETQMVSIATSGYTITPSGGAAIVPGTTDVGNHCDDCTTTIALPFSYDLYGVTYNNVTLSSNGNLNFGGANDEYENSCLPSSGFNYTIFAHWDDVRTDTGGGIFTSVSGSAPNRIFNIEWRTTYYGSGAAIDFEVRLYEGQQRFDVIFGAVEEGGRSATIGVQKGTGSDFTQYSCNSNSVSSGTLLAFALPSCTPGDGACVCSDADGDGHFPVGSSCQPADDCNDNDNTVYPGAPELCDGKDNDCDGQTDETIVSITASDPNAAEAGLDPGTFTVTRVGCTNSDLTVYYTVGGTASNGVDYVTLSGTMIIPAGSDLAPITVAPINDTTVECPETVIVTLSPNAAYTVDPTMNSAIVTIADNDLPTVTITASDASAAEPGIDTGTFTISRTGCTDAALAVNYTVAGTALEGSDYQTIGMMVVIPTGSGEEIITVSPLADSLVEGTESVVLTLGANPAYIIGASNIATVSIADSAPVANFSANFTNGVVPLTVTFTDISSGSITNRFWDFGDGMITNTTATNLTHTYLWRPPGDVNQDHRVSGADSLLVNQVLVGLRTTNDSVFHTNLTVRLVVQGPAGASTNNTPNYIGLGIFPNGDINASDSVTGADSLLINQVLVGLRSYVVSKILPDSHSSNQTTAVTIYGIGFPTNGTVTAVNIGPPVNLTLTNVVVINREQITALVPAGGGIGTGAVNVVATPTNGVTSFGRFINQ